MKRSLNIRIVTLALATSFGCSDDDSLPVTISDAGTDASTPSAPPSTDGYTTLSTDDRSVSLASDTTYAATSDGEDSIHATLDNDSTTSPGAQSTTEATTGGFISSETTVEATSEVTGAPISDATSAPTSEASAPASDAPSTGASSSETTTELVTAGGTSELVSTVPVEPTSSDDEVSTADAGPDSSVSTDVSTGEDVGTGECNDADECPTPSNPCLIAACHEHLCMDMPVGIGLEAREQTAGDCKTAQCNGQGGLVDVNDDNDAPNDEQDCTLDSCENGAPISPNAPPGATCDDGDGVMCDGGGNCVECLATGDCPGTDGECSWRTCSEGACGTASASPTTELEAQTAGDCKVVTCGGTVDDDDDEPNDNNACTADTCVEGTPTYTDVDPGEACGDGMICDGNGGCVGCIVADDCPGQDDECQARTCTNATCGVAYTAEGSPIAAQTEDDCRLAICDGVGNITWRNDTNDAPTDPDGCSTVSCSNGTPGYSPLGSNEPCGVDDASYCDGSGACVECTAPAQCGTDTECKSYTCVENTCGTSNAPAGNPTSSQSPGDCKENQCDGSGNIVPVTHNADLPVDGNQCTEDQCNAGTPDNPSNDAGDVCNQNGGFMCDGAGVCVECNSGSDCVSGVCNNHECGEATTNGCNIDTATDLGAGPVTITFANGNFTYAPKCVKVEQGASVTFNGNFASHPLMGGEVTGGYQVPASSGPFVPVTNSGNTKTVTMSTTGTFPYYCVPHGVSQSMNGAIFVVPGG